MKKVIISVIVIVLLVLGYSFFRTKGEKETDQPTDIPLGEFESPEDGENLIQGQGTKESYTETTETFEAVVKYPSFGNIKIDKDIKTFAMKDLSSFKSANDVTYDNPVAKNSYALDYRVVEAPETTSIIFTASEYTGGAHGNIRIRTLNYTNDGEEISIGSLFTPGSDYLSQISEISRAKLKKEMNDKEQFPWIDEGTTATSDNFDAFYLKDENTLTIIFQPYQVAAWVAGTPEIEIDLQNELGEILHEDYR